MNIVHTIDDDTSDQRRLLRAVFCRWQIPRYWLQQDGADLRYQDWSEDMVSVTAPIQRQWSLSPRQRARRRRGDQDRRPLHS